MIGKEARQHVTKIRSSSKLFIKRCISVNKFLIFDLPFHREFEENGVHAANF